MSSCLPACLVSVVRPPFDLYIYIYIYIFIYWEPNIYIRHRYKSETIFSRHEAMYDSSGIADAASGPQRVNHLKTTVRQLAGPGLPAHTPRPALSDGVLHPTESIRQNYVLADDSASSAAAATTLLANRIAND